MSCCFQHNAITVSPAPALLSPLPLRFNLSFFTFSLPHVSPSRFSFLPAASASLLFYFFLWACLRYKVSLFTMLTVQTAYWGLKVRITHYTHTFYTPFHLSSPLFHSLFFCGSEEFFLVFAKKYCGGTMVQWNYQMLRLRDFSRNAQYIRNHINILFLFW